jgi:anti-sigma regulatory factor (Ser/Thr protein kinase)
MTIPRRTAQAVAENVAWLRTEVADDASRAGLSAADVADVRLAVSEAVGNVVRHAYGGDPHGLVGVETGHGHDGFVVTVEDTGGGLQPRPRDGSRFGMAIIAALCDVTVSSGERGMQVTMRFARR